ncbi:hypothetical protein BKA66DRAFT_413852 [Pyrenochaeta sp. MPI-SDFR-AT-0127]|nr:hypothetical protein BKA66DRAFT_413852 [Pyrenochaeta sp. MPI-SDFR-AT-0127]
MAASTRRPYNAAILAAFVALSVAGAWFMRINIVMNKVPVGFKEVIASGVLPNGTPIKKHYTGIAPLDGMVSFLVAAFVYGPTGWNEPFFWQQLHFLVQITPMIAVLNVEACRERNRGSWVKYTAVLALLYQNIGGAVIVPFWWLLLHKISAEKSYFSSGRAVPLPYVSALLPATIFLYVIPTLAIYVPGKSTSALQTILGFWQFTPIIVNAPLWIASFYVSSEPSPPSKSSNEDDQTHLKVLYAATFVISTAVHWVVIIGILTSSNPEVTFSSVFLPSLATWKTTIDYGFLWIFQWDWIICAMLYLLPAWIAIYDVQRLLYGAATSVQLIKGAGAIAALTLLGGPGAALSGVWGWREEKLAVIEQRLSSGKKKL